MTNANTTKAKLDQISIYLFGKTEQLIEDYARSSQVPSHELTHRLAKLLLAQTDGQILRADDQVSDVRSNGTRRRAVAEPVEVAGSSHSRSASSLKGYSYNGTHWTQLPKNKKRLREQMARARARSRG